MEKRCRLPGGLQSCVVITTPSIHFLFLSPGTDVPVGFGLIVKKLSFIFFPFEIFAAGIKKKSVKQSC